MENVAVAKFDIFFVVGFYPSGVFASETYILKYVSAKPDVSINLKSYVAMLQISKMPQR